MELKNANPYLFAVVILNIVSWSVTGIVACCTVKATGNPYWALLMLIPAFFQMSYKEHRD